MEKYYLEVSEINQDVDDIVKITCYEKSTNTLVGYINIEMIFSGSDFLSDDIDDETYDEIFDSNDEFLFLQHIYVAPLYRRKGIGNFMLNKLFDEIIPKIFPNQEYIVLYRSCYDISNYSKTMFNEKVLKKFYESFGFEEIPSSKELPYNQMYMYKKINQ